MNNTQHFRNTLENLASKAMYHQQELMHIRVAEASLKPGTLMFFQVHVQSNWPRVKPVMAESIILHEALEEAKRIFREENYKDATSFEVFVRIGDFRVAIDPKDLPPGFTLDQRLTGTPAKIVFARGEKLPSAHYAENRSLIPA